MKNLSIKTFNGSIQNQPVQLINARELHEVLQSKQHFSDWIKKRISDFSFQENLDFIGVHKTMITEAGFFGSRQKEVKEYHITLDMAKELCMLERSELGRQARRYFIEQEKQARLLAEQNATLLANIPPFLLNNPDHTSMMVAKAHQAFFMAYPEGKEILRYREMGLTNPEIAKLLGVGKTTIERRQHPTTQLSLGFQG